MAASSVPNTVRDQLRPLVAGRTVLLATADPAGPALRHLRELGVGRILVLGPATCRQPACEVDAELVVVDLADENPGLTQQRWEAMLADPPPGLLRLLETHDPGRNALMLVSPWFETDELIGCPVFGAHRGGWTSYEHKLLADHLWEAAAVPHTPSLIVPTDLDALLSAVDKLDEGAGTVWTGSAADTPGYGQATRWIRNRADAQAAFTMLAGHHEQVRVMPFLVGQPCGISGMVLPDGVVALQPVEYVVLHTDADGTALPASVSSTAWNPPGADREQMREVVRRVGAALRNLVGKRSSFGVDGVLTSRGFLPTGCSTRWSPTLSCLAATLPDFPLQLTHHAVADGHDIGVRSTELEAFLLAATRDHRTAFVRGGPRTTALSNQQVVGAAALGSGWRSATYAEM